MDIMQMQIKSVKVVIQIVLHVLVHQLQIVFHAQVYYYYIKTNVMVLVQVDLFPTLRYAKIVLQIVKHVLML